VRAGATHVFRTGRGVAVLEVRGFPPSIFHSTHLYPIDATVTMAFFCGCEAFEVEAGKRNAVRLEQASGPHKGRHGERAGGGNVPTPPSEKKANRRGGEPPYARRPLFRNPVTRRGRWSEAFGKSHHGGWWPRRGIRLYPWLPTPTLNPAGACIGGLGGDQTLSPPGSA
jgi:hypothetical protein